MQVPLHGVELSVLVETIDAPLILERNVPVMPAHKLFRRPREFELDSAEAMLALKTSKTSRTVTILNNFPPFIILCREYAFDLTMVTGSISLLTLNPLLAIAPIFALKRFCTPVQ
jgi:hypothetical protein